MNETSLIDFSFSIEDWLGYFQQLFEIVADFFRRAFGIELFKNSEGAEDEGTETEGE